MHSGKKAKIGIVGGGVAGSSVALYLGELGLDVTLFEKSKSLVNGPPICHLHAGGNLYREISDEQCVTLLKESIELIRMYPQAIDYRPTIIAVPLKDNGKPEDLFVRLSILQQKYQAMIEEDINNKVLGKPEEYFKLFYKDEIEALKEYEIVQNPQTLEEWMIPFAKNIDLEKIQYPVVMVQEYGINIFRLAATLTLSLQDIKNTKVLTNSFVQEIEKKDESFLLHYENEGVVKEEVFDYLVNAAGFRSGEIDDMLGFERERLVEFKAAYVTKCKSFENSWPEIIFHGERGTPQGMAQFTPYPNGYFQLHGMTNDITLFDEGLVRSNNRSSQPKLSEKFLQKIEKGWSSTDVNKRTSAAIEHMAQYIPIFANAQAMSKPLFGAQQIPGEDASLRAADISFEGERYARCEIVKASSVLNMADAITKKLIELDYLDKKSYKQRVFTSVHQLQEESIQKLAEDFAECREYPTSLAHRSFSTNKGEVL